MNDYSDTEEWMEANHRLLEVWTAQTQRWMSHLLEGKSGAMEHPVVFDDLLGLNSKLIALAESMGELFREAIQYQAYFMPAWFEVWQKYTADPGSLTAASFEEATNNWFDHANKEMQRLQCTEEFLQVNKRIGQAFSHYKTCQQKVSDFLLARMDMPTQQELDNLSRSLFDLKREVRRLKEKMRQMQESRESAAAVVGEKQSTPGPGTTDPGNVEKPT